jgi:nucleoside-diphosphate-sugar epimerase
VLGGPENVDVRGFLAQAAEVAGIRPRHLLPMPPAVAVLYARLSLLMGGFDGAPAITPSWVRTLLESRTADIEPARREIGYAPRTLREGLAETVAWLGDGGR